MDDIVKIKGGNKLFGTIRVNGSKNAAVALIPASLLAKDVVVLENVPHIEDINSLLVALEYLNVKTSFVNNTLTIDGTQIENKPLIGDEIRKIRASYYFMGVLLALFGEVEILTPGGCNIGERPIDIHLDGFAKLGVEIEHEENIYRLHSLYQPSSVLVLRKPSVGATINLMLYMVLKDGVGIIENAAMEPEIVDVARLIRTMGGYVKGEGTSTITVVGGRKLHGCHYRVIPDRIETGTYAIIATALAKEVIIEGCRTDHCKAFLNVLKKCGSNMVVYDDAIIIKENKGLRAVDVVTNPYPGFPTDLQQPLTTLLTQANGSSIITENIYNKRIAHVEELKKMGANIDLYENNIIIHGPTPLQGSEISGKDLRGGASLILASLLAEGESTLHGFKHIHRGYDGIVTQLNHLGADIKFDEKGE